MFFLVIILVVLFCYWWYRLSTKSGYNLYAKRATGAIAKGKNTTEAIIYGLKNLQHRPPFDALTEEKINFIAEQFGPLDDITTLKDLIIRADKSRNLDVFNYTNVTTTAFKMYSGMSPSHNDGIYDQLAELASKPKDASN